MRLRRIAGGFIPRQVGVAFDAVSSVVDSCDDERAVGLIGEAKPRRAVGRHADEGALPAR